MIALDTNVLVRFFVDDDRDQADRAEAALGACTAKAPGFVAREVLLELVWVLERTYGRPRAIVADLLEGLLDARNIAVEAAAAAEESLEIYRRGGDFADAMIAAAARAAGAGSLVTFDRKFAGRIETTLL